MEQRPCNRRFLPAGLVVGTLGVVLAVVAPLAGVLLATLTLAAGVARFAYPRLHASLAASCAPPSGATRRPRPFDGPGPRLARGLFLTGVLLSTFNGLRAAPHLAYADVAFSLAASLVVALILAGAVRLIVPGWLLLSATLLSVAAVSAAVASRAETVQLLPALFFITSLAGVTVLALSLLTRPQHVAAVLSAFALSAVVNASVAIAAQLGLTDLPSRLMTWPVAGQQNGLTVHPNHLGLVCVLGIAALYGLRRWRPPGGSRGAARAGGAAAAVVLTGGVLVSGSRAALIALAALWCWALVADHEHRPRVVSVGVVIASAVSAAVLLWPPSADNLEGRQRFSVLAERTLVPGVVAGSNEARLDNMLLASREFQRSPLVGTGFSSARVAHNIYLQVLHSGGIVAFLGFVAYLANVALRGLALVHSKHEVRSLALGAVGATVAWLAGGSVQNALYDRFLYVAPAMVVVLYHVAVRAGAPSPVPEPSPVGASHHLSP